MSIRRAEEKDIEGIRKLLYQVNQVHADGRPDLFKSGGIKYTEDELKEIISDRTRPVFVLWLLSSILTSFKSVEIAFLYSLD